MQLPQSSTLKECVTRTNRLTTNSQLLSFNRVLTNGLMANEGTLMEFGMKRVMASVQAIAILDSIYCGEPVPLAAVSKESKFSVSYLEQIFKQLRRGKLVISHRGPGGGYAPREGEISVSEVIRAVSKVPANTAFDPVLVALDSVLISQLKRKDSSQ
jgi:Rrf2 family iron-sulfur cluster assembly transcriptional regulator